MNINMKTKKKKALKQLLKVTDKELSKITEKVLDDWANNIIQTKYKTQKTVDEIVEELDK